MRIFATAVHGPGARAIGRLELECTLGGLVLGLYGVGRSSDGYAPGALTHNVRLVVPWANMRTALVAVDGIEFDFEHPSWPHGKLRITRFSVGSGGPRPELARRKLILQLASVSLGVVAAALSSLYIRDASTATRLAVALLALAGVSASSLLIAYASDPGFLLREPTEAEVQRAFSEELQRFFHEVEQAHRLPAVERAFRLPNLVGLLPRTVISVGVALAACVLTLVLTTKRALRDPETQVALLDATSDRSQTRIRAQAEESSTSSPKVERGEASAQEPALAPPSEAAVGSMEPGAPLLVERRCLCDRADSVLWQKAIPRLTTLLLEKRVTPTKTSAKLELEVAVVNNGDAPVNDISLLVLFFEGEGKRRKQTKDRPLFYEGPLPPGHAIKWSVDARGTDFEIQSPDIGSLGENGEGAAPKEAFFELLQAKNRPVRLHAARMLGYLGDERAREAAMSLKEAYRAAEEPYLRRVLSALHEVRTCDLEVRPQGKEVSLGVCVFNAQSDTMENIGLFAQALSHPFDVNHPLANPPEIRGQAKWKVPERLEAQAGRYVRLVLPSGFLSAPGSALELTADRFDLLE